MRYSPELLDELARVYAQAAVDALLRELDTKTQPADETGCADRLDDDDDDADLSQNR